MGGQTLKKDLRLKGIKALFESHTTSYSNEHAPGYNQPLSTPVVRAN